MREIWIPLALITLFLFLHIIRPYIKKLKAIDGLAWLPLPALISTIGLIPAYGFRPETIPLLIYTLVLTMIVILKQLNGDIKFKNFRRSNFIFALFPLIILAATAGIAFYFTPQRDLSINTQGARTLTIDNYRLRIYTGENDGLPQNRPLLIILPPELGSFPVIDETTGKLRDFGFTVLALERKKAIGVAEFFRRVHVFFRGTVSARANKRGRDLEEKRKEDVQFILSWVRLNQWISSTVRLSHIASLDAVYIAGYDTGGSALVLLEDYISRAEGITVRGIIAIESPLWSLYQEEVNKMPNVPRNAGWFQSVRIGVKSWFQDIKPKKITGPDQIPELSMPVLFLVSDLIREPQLSKGRYEALLKCFSGAHGQAVLVSADGAGPLDYSDFPVRYPIITFMLRSRSAAAQNNPVWSAPVWNNDEAPMQTAAIISNFAVSVFNAEEGESLPLRRAGFPAGAQIEAKR